MVVKIGLSNISEETLELNFKEFLSHEQYNRYYNSEDQLQSGYVCKIENLFKDKFSFKYCTATNSATNSLIIALKALDIKRGDEVILSCYSFSACAFSILATGAIPVICPINENLQMDEEALDSLVNEKTKAVMVVHMRGIEQPLRVIKEKYGLNIIEDCSQFDGFISNGRLGNTGFSDISVYSFQSKKVISAGEGGMICTNNLNLYKKIFMLHDPAWDMRIFEESIDQNIEWKEPFFACARMNEITAMLIYPQLENITEVCNEYKYAKKKLINDLKIAYNTIKIKTYGKFNDESFNIIAKIDSEINLSNFEYHTYPESLNPVDPHYYFGWRNSIKEKCKIVVSLENSKNIAKEKIIIRPTL